MKRRIGLLFLGPVAAVLAVVWNPFIGDSFTASNPSVWYQNGSLTYGSTGLSSSTLTGGSLISRSGPPDGSSSYRVLTRLGIAATGGSFTHYLRATPDAMLGPTTQGSFLAVEFENTLGGASGCELTVRVYTRTNGVLTLHQSVQTGCSATINVASIVTDAGWLHVNVGEYRLISFQVSGVPATGLPGLGVRNAPPSNTVQEIACLPSDRVAPGSVQASTISTWTAPSQIDFQWKGVADDAAGGGLYAYHIWRGGTLLATVREETFSDSTVSAGQSYTYQIAASDLHGNVGTPASISVTAPPAGSRDARRVGVTALGTHWGAGGENIDLRSGNLNFTLPLLAAAGRGSVSFPVSLSYNSQNWRQDTSTSWKLGRDTGYGFGWHVSGGSLTPYFSNYWDVHHFVFKDSTGAEYTLYWNADGIYRAQGDGVYLSFSRTDNRLRFNDGSFWEFGSISDGEEQDGGTMHPTKIQDSNGNQILITYKAGLNAQWSSGNSSSRLNTIEDGRASSGATYSFTYTNIDSKPHLTGISNTIGTAESYTISYDATQILKSPFDPNSNFGTVARLTQVQNSIGSQHFSYGGNQAGELTSTTSPYGAELSWTYSDFSYASSKKFREVTSRCLKATAYATQQCWTLTPDAGDSSRQMHSKMTLSESGGNGVKVYQFETDMGLASAGLLKTYQEQTASAPVSTLKQLDHTWAVSSSGQPFIQEALTTLGGATSAQSKTWQNIDGYGNLVEKRIYDYGNLSTPKRTYTYSYLTNSTYLNAYIRNRLLTASVTDGTNTRVLTTRTYDNYNSSNPCYPGMGGTGLMMEAASTSPAPRLYDAAYTTTFTTRGNLSTETKLGQAMACLRYNSLGSVISTFTYNNLNGAPVAITWDGGHNYAVPQTITPNDNTAMQQSASYNAFLGTTQVQLPESVTVNFGWDAVARPSTTQSPHGAVTNHTYAIDAGSATPYIHTATINGRWTKTYSDGLGRTTRVEKGYGSTTVSVQDTEYGLCACSPTGKVKRVSMPYAPGGTPQWTTYSYDASGRTVSILKPGNTNAITYTYAGNTVKVTDEQGKWKTQTLDVFGNIQQVTEPIPTPNSTSSYAWSGTNLTTYDYNLMDQMTTATMTRGGTTQTRTWVYDASHRLTSESLPETGTTTFTYDAGGRRSTKTDARGAKTEWVYDTYSRVSEVKRYQPGAADPDATQGELYTYSASGRLSSIKYGFTINGSGIPSSGVTENYSYTASGLPTGKTLTWPSYRIGTLGITYTYDTSTTKEGRLLSMRYPTYWDPSYGTTRQGLGLTFEYDDMGRMLRVRNTDTQEELVRSPAYNVAGQLTQWERKSEETPYSGWWLTENFSYTTQGQLDRQRMKLSSASADFLDDQYYYNDAGDGTVKQRKDNAAGNAVDYTYNVLGQLIKAETTSNEWGQSFVFDGFGNLTQQVVTKGSAPSMTLNVNPANNRVTGSGIAYDAAGNLTSYLWPPYNGSIYYDLANRAYSTVGGSFRYTARNERLTVLKFDGTREVHMRGLGGEMIGVYRIDWENGNSSYTKPVRLPERERVYAAGRLLFEGGKFVATDRLGSVAYKFGTGLAVQNGGFESYQLAPWASYGVAQISISNVSRTGLQSMRLTTTVSDYGAYQDVKGLVAGMSYQFQTWVRAESGTNLAVLAVCEPAGGGFVWTGPQTITTDWRLLTVYFTATSNGTARIILAKYDTTGALLWDDVEMPGGATAISGVKMRYHPYGQEVGTATANDVSKFGTYTRDAGSGLDYAMNRYYQSWWGRFTSPDQGPAVPTNPLTWNRYSYTWNDPINLNDPDGMLPAAPPGCVAYPFGSPDGSIDTSSNCPPGYIEVDTWNTGSWTSLSPLRQVHDAVTLLENIVDVNLFPSGRGYGIGMGSALFSELMDAGTIQIGAGGVATIGGIWIHIDVVGVIGGTIGGVVTSPVTITVVGVAALSIVAWHIYQTSRGNVKDSGIQAEAEEMVRRGAATDICDALERLLGAAKAIGDKTRQKRIVTTQKGNDCRKHRP